MHYKKNGNLFLPYITEELYYSLNISYNFINLFICIITSIYFYHTKVTIGRSCTYCQPVNSNKNIKLVKNETAFGSKITLRPEVARADSEEPGSPVVEPGSVCPAQPRLTSAASRNWRQNCTPSPRMCCSFLARLTPLKWHCRLKNKVIHISSVFSQHRFKRNTCRICTTVKNLFFINL